MSSHMASTHQAEGEEEDEQDGAGQHGETQQQHQRLVLTDAGELPVERFLFQLLVIQQVLPLGRHGESSYDNK